MNILCNSPDSNIKEKMLEYINKYAPQNSILRLNQDEIISSIFEVSQEYGILPEYILAHIVLETGWGTSIIAKEKKNLFGFQAYDNSPYVSAKSFNSYSSCIFYCMKYLKQEYLSPTGKYYSGTTLKDINKYYATDKNWFKKIEKIIIEIRSVEMKTIKEENVKLIIVNLFEKIPEIITLTGEKDKDILKYNVKTGQVDWVSEVNKKYIDGKKVVQVANSYVGKFYKKGEKAQCMNFVRHCLELAGYNIPVTKSPSDKHLIPSTEQMTGYSLANSLAGDDVGDIVQKYIVGDIIFFQNTYGNYPIGVITHVGIYDEGGYMIHRPTEDRPVEKILINDYNKKIKEVRRLFVL